MNRLWVRFSLVIVGAIVLLVLVMFASRFASGPLDPFHRAFSEAKEVVPAETADQFREIVRRDAWSSLSVFIAAGATISLVVGIWFSRGLTAPLGELEAAAQAIEAQDLSYRVPVQGSQELKAVATSFNQMADQLEQSEVLRRNLLADVAHELRGPLHLIKGNLQAILDDVYPLSKEEIARLFDQTRHLTGLVNDLHELAQAEANQLPLATQTTEIAELVKSTVVAFKPTAAAQDVALQVELLGTLPTLEIDIARIRQVIHNLLGNALRHTPKDGQVRVTVEWRDEVVQVNVHDSGEGIAPEHLAHVFDRFYRTDSGRSRDKGGTGLGLAIAKAIVDAHGGDIIATSPGLGKGSTFTLYLPT